MTAVIAQVPGRIKAFAELNGLDDKCVDAFMHAHPNAAEWVRPSPRSPPLERRATPIVAASVLRPQVRVRENGICREVIGGFTALLFRRTRSLAHVVSKHIDGH